MTSFIRHLRQHGYTVGIPETADIIDQITQQQSPSRQQTWHLMRALTCRNKDQWLKFDQHFRRFWFPDEVRIDELSVLERIDARLRPRSRSSGIAGSSSAEPDSSYGDAGLRGTGAGGQRDLTKTDYRFLNDQRAMDRVEAIAEQLAYGLRRKLTRRRQFYHRGEVLNLRRTMRKSLSTSGFPIKRVFAQRKQEPIHIVLFHDISHSMAWNNPLLFRFARGLVRCFNNCEAFAFHTRLFRVTDYYRESSLTEMRKKLEANNKLWMGGTRIGDSLETFLRDHARSTLTPKTVVMIISDGFDTNDPELLQQQLSILSSRCKSIIWLNPMLGRPGVSTTPESLSELFPQVDCFIPAHNLHSLKQSTRLLLNTAAS